MNRRLLFAILIIALALRLVYGLALDHSAVYTNTGGDSLWYLANGYALASGVDRGSLPGYGDGEYPIELKNLPTPPVYLLFVGLFQMLFPGEGAIVVVRVIQALMGTAICYFAYRLTRSITDDERAGLLAAGLLAVSPVFVMETAQITTETVYMFLVTAALTLYVTSWQSVGATRESPFYMLVVGILLGLATLTRAVLLLFPLGLMLHLVMVKGWRTGLRQTLLMMIIYVLVVSTWTIYSKARWDRFVIAGEGFAAFLYVGATETGWQGPDALDQALGEIDNPQAFTEGAGQLISADPLGWARRRISELVESFLQPHGTMFFSGESLRDISLDWAREDRSLSGLLDLTRGDAFWPKLVLYVFHYAGLILGVAGLWLTRARWRVTLPLIAFILYTALVHLILTALPRYVFPTEVFWWVFASAAIVQIYYALHRRTQPSLRV